ncbi:MAG: hypothetical protein HZA54_16550, partial [Planctomycetes bacterium]|nr:hypothetical protein [Planctomycetota bacterium]
LGDKPTALAHLRAAERLLRLRIEGAPEPPPPPAEAPPEAAAPAAPAAAPAPAASDPLMTLSLEELVAGANEPIPGAPGPAAAAPGAPAASAAPGERPPLRLSGSLTNEAAFRTSQPNEPSKVLNLAQLQAEWHPAEALSFTAIGRGRYDAVFDLTDHFSERAEEVYAHDVDLREAYGDFRTSAFHLRAGRQQIAWGDTIGLKVLDLVNPQEFREFIFDDFVDSRIPLYSLRAEYLFGNLGPFKETTLEGIWIPDLRFHELAEPGSEFFVAPPPGPPGIPVTFRRERHPSPGFENAEWGFRARTVLGSYDLSLSYFNTYDDTPVNPRVFDLSTFSLLVAPEHHRTQVAGVTLTNAFGGLVLSTEVAWWIRRGFDREDLEDDFGVTEKDFVNFVIGADHKVLDADVGVQFFQSIVVDHEEALLAHETDSALSLYVRKGFVNDTLTATAFLLHDLGTGDEWVRLEAGYDLTDRLNLKLGTDLIEGKEGGQIGRFDHADRVYTELKFSF